MNPIETVAIDTLTPHPQNPRRGNIDAIAESIRTNGWWGVIVAQTSTRHVLAGNHRLQAARLAGLDTVPVHWLDVPDDVALRVLLADNRSADQAGYDDDSLAELLAAIRDETGTLDGTLFTSDDLDQLLADLAPLAAVEASDDAPAVPAEAKTRPGDVFDLGPHRLVCGDSTDPDVWARLIEGDTPEAMWTDPPYGVSYEGKTKDALTIENDGAAGLPSLLQRAFAAADAHLAPGARLYITCAPGRNETTFRLAIDNAGWTLHQGLVWVKDVFVLGHSDYHYQHETILYSYKPGTGRIGRGNHDGTRWYGDHAQPSVFNVDRPKRSEEHPTMKPVALVERCLSNSTKRGDVVVDPFGGSGTTLIAADALGRRARLIELDPAYCDVIRQRYADHANRPDLAP